MTIAIKTHFFCTVYKKMRTIYAYFNTKNGQGALGLWGLSRGLWGLWAFCITQLCELFFAD